jgi:hypothetical protein
MPNGDCVIGAENKTKIKNLERENAVQNSAIEKVNGKLDSINSWLLVTLGAVVVNLIMLAVQLVAKGVEAR